MIKDRCVIPAQRIAEAVYSTSSLRDLRAVASEMFSRTSSGQLIDAWCTGSPSAFTGILGLYAARTPMGSLAGLLLCPGAYINTAGFAFWGPEAVLLVNYLLLKEEMVIIKETHVLRN